jgi:hypothetical protein
MVTPNFRPERQITGRIENLEDQFAMMRGMRMVGDVQEAEMRTLIGQAERYMEKRQYEETV